MKYEAVIFDLDGTLLDTLEDIADGVNHALRVCGYPPRTTQEIRKFVGNGAVKLLERALPCTVDREAFRRLYDTYDTYYTAHSMEKTAPYAGVMELLRVLRALGMRIAVFSNKQDNAVRPLCAHYFGDLLDHATGPTADVPKKPDPQGIFFIAEQLHTPLDRVLYVGDSETDVQTGLRAGVRTIAALWGFRDRETLKNAGAVDFAQTPMDILSVIKQEQ